MYQVGTQAGVVNKQRQGTGLATVLQDTEQADDYFLKYMDARATAAQKKADEKEAAKNAALGKIMGINPDFFYKHQKEIADQVALVQQKGVEAMKAGANDPAVGADPYSVEYQKELNRLNQMSKFSKQIEQQFEERKKLIASDPDKYEPDSIIGLESYSDISLADHMANPQSPPNFKLKMPYKDVMTMADSIAVVMTKGRTEGADIDDAKGIELTREFLANPAERENVLRSLTQAFANLSEKEQQSYSDRAATLAISGPELFLYELAKKSVPGRAPFNPAEALSKSGFAISEKGYKGAETYSSGPDATESMRSAIEHADRLINQTSDAFPAFVRYYNITTEGRSEKDIRELVRNRIAKSLYEGAPKNKESGVVSGSGASPERDARTTDWVRTILSGNSYAAQLAADGLRNVEIGNGYKVERAMADPILTGEGNKTKVQVKLVLKGPVKSAFSKQEAMDLFGLKDGEVKEGQQRTLEGGQLEKEMIITTDADNQEFFRSMYLEAEKNGYRWNGFESTLSPSGTQNAPIQTVKEMTDRARGGMATPPPSKPAKTVEELLGM